MVAWPVANAQSSKVTGRLPGPGHSLAMSWGGLSMFKFELVSVEPRKSYRIQISKIANWFI